MGGNIFEVNRRGYGRVITEEGTRFYQASQRIGKPLAAAAKTNVERQAEARRLASAARFIKTLQAAQAGN